MKVVLISIFLSFNLSAHCPKINGSFSYKKRNIKTLKIEEFYQVEELKNTWEGNDQAYDKLSISQDKFKFVHISINNQAPIKYRILNKVIDGFSFKKNALGKPKPLSINFKFNKKCQHKLLIKKGD